MLCECGCGEKVLGGFKPGHDQKLRIALEQRVGGLLALRSLVEAAERLAAGHSQSELIDKVRRILAASYPSPVNATTAPSSPYHNESGSMSDDHIG